MEGEDLPAGNYEAPNPLPKGAKSAAAEPQSHSDGQSTCLDETEASPTSNSTGAIYECANWDKWTQLLIDEHNFSIIYSL